MDNGAETIRRQTRASYCCLFSGQSPWTRASTAQPIGCTSALVVSYLQLLYLQEIGIVGIMHITETKFSLLDLGLYHILFS